MKRLSLIGLSLAFLSLLFLLAPSPAAPQLGNTPAVSYAQDGPMTCADLLNSALPLITCGEVGRGEACLAYPSASALLNNGTRLETADDRMALAEVAAISTQNPNLLTGEWGMAVLNIGADLPTDSPPLRMVMLGGVTVVNLVSAPVEDRYFCRGRNTSLESIRVRAGADTAFAAIDELAPSESVLIYGQDREWVQTPLGWVFAPLLSTDCDFGALPTITTTEAAYPAPFQRMAVSMVDDGTCPASPSGLLLQAPPGQTVSVRLNETDVRMSSTVLVNLSENNTRMTITNLSEGNVTVTARNFSRPLPYLHQVEVELAGEAETLRASAEPSEVTALNRDDVRLSGRFLSTLNYPTTWQPRDALIPQTIRVSGTFTQSQCDGVSGAALPLSEVGCHQLGKNAACIGHQGVTVGLNDESLPFAAAGDVTFTRAIEQITTLPLDPTTGNWGIVTLNLQADLNPQGNETVRAILFGGAQLTSQVVNPVTDYATCTATNARGEAINLRAGPSLGFPIIDNLNAGESLRIVARNADASWLRAARGWVYAPLVETTCAGDISALRTAAAPLDSYFTPLHAFRLTMADGAGCAGLPNGVLLQAPLGETATVSINNVQIRLGSTALITLSQNNTLLNVANLEGKVDVTALGYHVDIPLGAQVSVPLVLGETDLTPTDIPTDPQPIPDAVRALDTRLLAELPRAVTMPLPYNPDTATPVFIPQAANETSGWGACGSCTECLGPDNECVRTPDNTCVWDAARCGPPPVLQLGAGDVTCIPFVVQNTIASYYASDGHTIVAQSAVSQNTTIAGVISVTPLSPTTFRVQVICASSGTTRINLTITDTNDRAVSGSFQVRVN